MDPDLDLAQFVDEDYLFADVEIPHFLVEKLEAMECCFGEVKLVWEGYVVDFLEAKIHFLCVQPALVNRRAHILHGIVNERLDGVDKWGEVVVALMVVLPCDLLARWFLSESKLLPVGEIVAFGGELQLILFDLFIGAIVPECPDGVGVDIGEQLMLVGVYNSPLSFVEERSVLRLTPTHRLSY